MTNNRYQSRRQGLLADLNFTLPYVASTKGPLMDVTMIIRKAGKRRKQDRHTIDVTNLLTRINPNQDPDGWNPKLMAIGNDRSKNLFLVFDNPDIDTSLELARGSNRIVLNSKSALTKVLLCLKDDGVIGPTIPDTGLLIEFDAQEVKDAEGVFRLIPKRHIQEYADEKATPKVINFKS